MIVDMWMTHDPLTVDPATSVSAAALLMAHRRIRRLVVVERGHGHDRVVGIVSAGDVARAFPPDLNPVSAAVTERSVPQPVTAIMSRQVRTIAAGTAIEEAARVLQVQRIGAVPVLRGERLVGIITESDVFRAFVEMSDAGTPGVRVTFDLDENEDVTATMGALCAEHGARVASLFSFHHHDASAGERRRLGVVRIAGEIPAGFLEAIWSSRHRVLSVVREPASA